MAALSLSAWMLHLTQIWVFARALGELLQGRLTADLAVSLAAVGALFIGQNLAAAEVMFIMLLGGALEEYTAGRARSGIAAILALRPAVARVRRDGQDLTVPVADVRRDDVVLLRPGDRIPVDGRVLRGGSAVDESAMTGEAVPVDKGPGDDVYEGTTNLHGAMEIEVVRQGADTALARVLHLVEEAAASRAPIQRLADRWARWFVPAVLLAAGLVAWRSRDPIRAVSVLVVACPCALVLATPAAIAAAIGALARRGVLVKGGAALETLARLRSILFDKTGTLTQARLQVAAVVPAAGLHPDGVLATAAVVEQASEHPIARVIVEEARRRGLAWADAQGFLAHPGLGAQADVAGETSWVGNARLMAGQRVSIPPELLERTAALSAGGCTVVWVASGGRCLGAIAVRDSIRPEAVAALHDLRRIGLPRIALVTGDQEPAARTVAAALGIPEVRAQLLPSDKVAEVRRRAAEAGPVAMIGDGINDAPALAAADVGIAMADIGTDVAVESADVVLIGGDLRKVGRAVATARRARRIVVQNILGFALLFNGAAVAMAALGRLPPVAAAVVHQIGSLAVILNSMRLLIDAEGWRRRATQAADLLRRRRRALAHAGAVGAALAWAASGVSVVGPGQVAVVRTFGRAEPAPRLSGLHWRWPWPFGRIDRLRPLEVRRVEIGFRSVPGSMPEPPAYDWNIQHRGGRYVRVEDEAMVWTGDENLADLNLVVHYRVSDPYAALFRVGAGGGADRWDEWIRRAAEAALRAEAAGSTAEAVLSDRRREFEAAVARRLSAALAWAGSAFEVLECRLADAHPPLEVVPAFREVTEAHEAQEARINMAQGHQFATRSLARGEAVRRRVDAAAAATNRVLRALGEAERFARAAGTWREAPDVGTIRLRFDALEAVLEGRRKLILDSAAAGGRRLIWLGTGGELFRDPTPSPAPANAAAQEETSP